MSHSSAGPAAGLKEQLDLMRHAWPSLTYRIVLEAFPGLEPTAPGISHIDDWGDSTTPMRQYGSGVLWTPMQMTPGSRLAAIVGCQGIEPAHQGLLSYVRIAQACDDHLNSGQPIGIIEDIIECEPAEWVRAYEEREHPINFVVRHSG